MEFWSEVLKKISERISKPSFDTWFANTTIEVENNTIKVHVPNVFAAEWVAMNYNELIQETVKEITSESYRVEYVNDDYGDASELSYKHSTNVINHEEEEIINEMKRRIEQLEDRVRQLEEKG